MIRNDDYSLLLAKLYRSHFGKMVGDIIYHTGIKDMAIAEDIVQEAFVVASEKWGANLPDHPEAWLYKTIRNMAYTALKKEDKKRLFEEEYEATADIDKELQLLRVLYVCVQSTLSPKIQLVIALRYINGLQVKRIAALLGTDEDGISKILYRWRAQCKNQQWDFKQEVNFNNKRQVSMVLNIVYVMFTEGFRVSSKGGLIDQAICEDALSLLQTLIKMKVIANGEVKALYALLLYHLARSCSRLNEINELIALEQQDRSCWNKEMIAVANGYLWQSKKETKSNNSYQIEAAIAYLHTSAPAFETINWLQIIQLYAQLQLLSSSPFVKLNYAAALYFGGKQQEAIQMLDELNAHHFFRKHHLLHCFWARVHSDQGHFVKALDCYKAALIRPISRLEEQFIKRKISMIIDLNCQMSL